MKTILSSLTCIFSFVALAQLESVTVEWTPVKMTIPANRFVPRELFKINDSTLYLGCRNYVLKVAKDSLRIEFEEPTKDDKNVVRSVISHKDTLYISDKSNSVLSKHKDNRWVNILDGRETRGNINWEMVVYKDELIYTTWPRWIEVYNFDTKSWNSSPMLDEQGAGYVSGFEKTKDDLFVSLYGGGVFKKDKKSDNWINCNKGLPKNFNVRGITAVDNTKMFAATEDGIYYSKLKNNKWKPCRQTQGLGTKYVDLMYYKTILYATGTDGELMISNDLGKKWTNVKIRDSKGYVLYSIEAIKGDLYISAEGQNGNPSAVFMIPISHVLYKYPKKAIVCFQ